jgi:hypothetical protein
MQFLQRDMIIGDLARHLTAGSDDEARDRRYIWDARRFSEAIVHTLELEVMK